MREDLLDVPRIVAVAVVVIEIATITELEGDAAQRDPEDGQKNDRDEAHPQPAHAPHANTNRTRVGLGYWARGDPDTHF